MLEEKGNEVEDQICNMINCMAPSIGLKNKRRYRIVGVDEKYHKFKFFMLIAL